LNSADYKKYTYIIVLWAEYQKVT